MSVANQFSEFLTRYKITTSDRIVVACSTGVDSMVLADLFLNRKQNFILAHVNHGIRETSRTEEEFCRTYCLKNGIEFEILHLNPQQEKPVNVNFQHWAREKRYTFFHQVAEVHGCKYIATAHHATDKAETFFINAIRGSGAAGLGSLKEKHGHIIRPLIRNKKEDLLAYAAKHLLHWHEDDSNEGDAYLRNRIRHHVLPALDKVDPNWQAGLKVTAKSVEGDKNLIDALVKGWEQRNVRHENGEIHISISALQEIDAKEALLWHLLRSVDPSLPVDQLAKASEDQTGSRYIGNTHLALKDRDWLIVRRGSSQNQLKDIHIHADDSDIKEPVPITFEKISRPKSFSIGQMNLDKSTALLDFDKLSFPLIMRKWKTGDKFRPLGMKGFKKISDFLIDEKISLFDKENIHVIVSNEHVVWVVGQRIDDRFKVGKDTQIMYLGRLHNPRV